jgi:hypothetical protein
MTAGAAIAGVAGISGLVSCVSDDNGGGAAADASFPDVTTPDSGGIVLPDASARDTGFDVTVDTGAIDTGIDTGVDVAQPDTGPTCAPGSIAAFVAPSYVPAAPQSFICGHPEEIALGADCFGDASTVDACATFPSTGLDGGPVDPNCLSCLFSDENDAGEAGVYGPVVRGVVPVANVAGCIQTLDPSDAGYDCAAAVQAAWQCAEFACKAACPVTDDPSRAAYLQCARDAATTVCATYTTAARACIATETADGGVAAGSILQFCFAGADPGDQLATLAAFFCTS